MITFDEKITVDVAPTDIEEEGRGRINRLLTHSKLPELPEDWVWARCIQKGEYRGKFPKRVATYYKKVHEEHITSTLLTRIGNRVEQFSFGARTYEFDFTRNLNWSAGEFGDHGSCFWTCRTLAREALMKNDVFAVHFYRDSGKGFARAFVFEVDNGLVIFNAYGLPCRTIAYVLATLFSYQHRDEVSLCINGDEDGLVWLNEDAHRIGSEPFKDRYTANFDIEYALCRRCDDFYPIAEGDHNSFDEFVCDNCW